jgi:L-ribulose-5-phosphate 3-epimerase
MDVQRSLNRRAMLCRSAQVGVLMKMGAGGVGSLLAAPGSRWFKIGAPDWSLGKDCDPAAFDVAKQAGLDGVQVNMGRVANNMHLRQPDLQKVYLQTAKRTGLEIASLAIGEMNQVPLKSDPRAAQWLDESIDICKTLGLTVTMPAFFHAGDLDMAKTAEIDHVIKVLKDVLPKAEKLGITIGMENYLSAKDNMRIIDRVGSPALKVYYDVGNSTVKGYDILKEIRTLGKLICELHFKDNDRMLGQGSIDFKKVRKALDHIDYSGWIQLETVAPHGVVADFTTNRRYIRGIFPEHV